MVKNKKHIIKRTTLRYDDGTYDILESEFETDNLEVERTRLLNQYKCKRVHFRFISTDERYINTGDVFKLIKENKGNVSEEDLCEFLDNSINNYENET